MNRPIRKLISFSSTADCDESRRQCYVHGFEMKRKNAVRNKAYSLINMVFGSRATPVGCGFFF